MRWRNPIPTVDVVIELDQGIVLIRRANPPEGWALPGGFVDEGETVEAAARREALEETGLDVELRALLHVYSDPFRDPRQHTMSTVFTARASGAPVARDDAAEVLCVSVDRLGTILRGEAQLPRGLSLAFDHGRILRDYLVFRETGRRPFPAVDRDRGSAVGADPVEPQ